LATPLCVGLCAVARKRAPLNLATSIVVAPASASAQTPAVDAAMLCARRSTTHPGAFMSTIIAGHFRELASAEQARADLAAAGFALDQLATFFVSPAGQHDLTSIGGDEDASAGAEDAGGGAVSGAAIGGAIGVAVGLSAMAELGPAAAFAGGGVGAYVGSLFGAVGNMRGESGVVAPAGADGVVPPNPHRQSGMQVAVAAPDAAQQASAIRILRARGATDIEEPEGSIVAGDWTDFDPLSPLRRVAG
jgi:hypothetical protein